MTKWAQPEPFEVCIGSGGLSWVMPTRLPGDLVQKVGARLVRADSTGIFQALFLDREGASGTG
jgi:hypothetical protein